MNKMMRAVVVYGVVLAVALGAAWFKWTAEPDIDLEGKIVLLPGDSEDITTVRWKSEKDEALIERKEDEAGTYWWTTYTKWTEPKPVKPEPPVPAEPAPTDDATADDATADDATADDATADDATADDATADDATADEPPAEKVADTSVFKAGDAADKMAEALSPMLAIRKLEDVPADKLATIGLDDASAKDLLEIVRKGRTTTLEVGGEAYGTRDRYVRNVATGDIFLVDDEVLRPLRYARTRLPDRNLFSLESADITKATLEGSASTLDVVHKNPQDADKEAWARTDSPEEASEELKTWLDKALKMKGTSYADPAALPEGLEYRFKLSLQTDKGESETLEVKQVGADGDWYGTTEFTRAPLKLLRGPTSGLYEDIDGLISGS